jgi:hypothetical protein
MNSLEEALIYSKSVVTTVTDGGDSRGTADRVEGSFAQLEPVRCREEDILRA